MREALVEEILALSDDEVKLFIALLEQFEGQELPVELLRPTSA